MSKKEGIDWMIAYFFLLFVASILMSVALNSVMLCLLSMACILISMAFLILAIYDLPVLKSFKR